MNRSLNRYWSLLATYLRPQMVQVGLLTALLFGGIGLQLINPQIIRYFIDTTQAGGPQIALLAAAGLFLGIALTQRFVAIATTYVGENVGWRATNALRADLALHCLRLDMQFHQRRTPGELIERIDGDVTAMANFFSQLVINIIGNGLLLVGILLLLFREDWRVGSGLTVYALLTLVTLLVVQRFAVSRWADLSQANAEQSGFLEERMSGTEDTRANGGEGYVLRRLYGLMRNRLHQARRAFVTDSLNGGLTRLLYAVGYTLGLSIGVYLFTQGQATVGTVYLIIYYIGTLATPLEQIKNEIGDLQKATASMGRVDELLNMPLNIVERVDAQLPAGALGVEFQQVSFSYGDERRKTKDEGQRQTENQPLITDHRPLTTDHHVLRDISFRVQPGRVLGVLGRTGSGKTTLTRLLFRLYDPQKGAVELSDIDIRDLSLSDLRSKIGMVTQDVQLFGASVRDNLALFNKHISDEAMMEVLRMIGLGDWFAALPAGLDTPLQSGGSGLSAGQAQLLAFTRVFLKNPGLVILDEASSRLDPATERLLERAIDRLFLNRTGIIIAHRLGTVQRADDILILDDGEIVEYGPRELLAADPNSRFAHLLRTGLEEVLA